MYFSSVVRFEDLASNPRQSLQDLMKRMDLFVTQSGLNYIETHTLRDRFKEVGKTSCNKILTKTEALVLVSFSQTLLNEIRQKKASNVEKVVNASSGGPLWLHCASVCSSVTRLGNL